MRAAVPRQQQVQILADDAVDPQIVSPREFGVGVDRPGEYDTDRALQLGDDRRGEEKRGTVWRRTRRPFPMAALNQRAPTFLGIRVRRERCRENCRGAVAPAAMTLTQCGRPGASIARSENAYDTAARAGFVVGGGGGFAGGVGADPR